MVANYNATSGYAYLMNKAPNVDLRRWTRLFSFGLEQCSPQAALYGSCVVSKLGNVRKGVCEAEWEQLKKCLESAIKTGGKYKRV